MPVADTSAFPTDTWMRPLTLGRSVLVRSDLTMYLSGILQATKLDEGYARAWARLATADMVNIDCH